MEGPSHIPKTTSAILQQRLKEANAGGGQGTALFGKKPLPRGPLLATRTRTGAMIALSVVGIVLGVSALVHEPVVEKIVATKE